VQLVNFTHPESSKVFKNHARDILQGKVLNVEGLVDVLTLKDNGESMDDYATALQLLARAEVVSS
jgi:nuclear pore complex protein Nup133